MTALTKVAPGAPLRIKAEDYNACLDAARAYRAGVWNQKASNQGSAKDGAKILISNQTGDDLDRLSVVELDGVEIAPEDNEPDFISKPIVKAVLPEGRGRAIAVLQEPAKDGALAMATISGIVAVNLTVKSQSHQFANVIAGETDHLESAEAGPARIIYAGSSTGDEPALALVQIPFVESKGGGEPFARMGHFPDASGVEGGFPKFTPDKVIGSMIVPRMYIMAPVVPISLDDWKANTLEYGIEKDTVQQTFAVDATQTGDSLDLYLVIVNDPQGLCLKQLVCTMQKSTDLSGSENYYWKGGVVYQPWQSNENTTTITTGFSRHESVATDPDVPSITFDGDLSGLIAAGQTFKLNGSDDTFTAKTVIFDGSQTTIVTEEPIVSGGTLIFGGRLLINNESIKVERLPRLLDQMLDVTRDDASNSWIYYPTGNSYTQTRVGSDIHHPFLEIDGLPSIYGPQSMLFEHIPGSLIPKGHHTVEAMGDGTTKLRFRYRHHTSGDLYEGILDLPDSNQMYAMEPFEFGVACWKEYGSPVIYMMACFGIKEDYTTLRHSISWYGAESL